MNNDIKFKPKIFNCSIKEEMDLFNDLCSVNKSITKIDTLADQKHELSLVEDPSLISHKALTNPDIPEVSDKEGVWIYFAWKNTAVRILDRDKYEKLRMSRNKNLITEREQEILKNKTIAIAGLNVGNPGAVCLTLEGIGEHMKLADFDPLSVSNLNRFRAGLTDLNINKAYISARQMYEINPFVQIDMFEKGITDENIEMFLGDKRVDLLIEEMDNLRYKIKIREMARELKIPVLMVTGSGDHVIIDVERYDKDGDLPLLSGYLKDEVISKIESIKPGEGTFRDRVELLQDFMGKEYLDSKLNSSFDEVGLTIASIPQVAESSFLRGAALTHFAKKILLNEDLKSGRYEIKLDGTSVNKYD